jgi:p-aminobenzoyl-glutamate transporter AbgT
LSLTNSIFNFVSVYPHRQNLRIPYGDDKISIRKIKKGVVSMVQMLFALLGVIFGQTAYAPFSVARRRENIFS